MVGISLGSFSKLGRWIGRLSVRQRASGAAVVLALVVAAVWGVSGAQSRARLLRSDPDLIPADAALMRYSLGRGHAIFEQKCASCHGAKATGNMTRGIPNLTDDDTLYGTGQVSDIETVILYGIRSPNPKTWRLADMPAFARPVPYPREPAIKPLTPNDITDVIAYLGFMRGAKVAQDAAIRGNKIFSDRGGCYDCHGDGHGDDAIGAPNLADNIWLYGGSPRTQFESIAYGRAGYCPDWEGRLSRPQIRETALYVYSLSHPNPPKTSSGQ